MLDRISETMSGLVDQGRKQADVMRMKRQRSRLVHDLGELCYRSRTGVVASGEIDRLVDEIASLDQAVTDVGEPEPTEPEMSYQPTSTGGTSAPSTDPQVDRAPEDQA